MTSKFNNYLQECDEIRAVLKRFSDAAFQRFDGYAYSAGYMESKLVEAISLLPRSKRDVFKMEIRQATDFCEKAAALEKSAVKSGM
jgi:hypothetical protein